MPFPIAAVAGIAVLGALLGGNKNGGFLTDFHEHRMDRVHNRAEAHRHKNDARHGVGGTYTTIHFEQPKPVRTAHTVSTGGPRLVKPPCPPARVIIPQPAAIAPPPMQKSGF